jgi:DNA invertase Pin-like site-specific DNA recombinase
MVEIGLLEHRTLRKRGIRVLSAAGEGTEGEDPSHYLQRGITDLFSEHERRMISARTRAALRAKRARGERAGAIPYGFHLVVGENGRIELDEAEQRGLALIAELRARGKSYRAICRDLKTREIPSKKGGQWYPESVRSVLMTRARAAS